MRLRDSRRSARTEHEAERGGRAAELLGEPVARERELIFETKRVLVICRNEFELLRYACPHCGETLWPSPLQPRRRSSCKTASTRPAN